MLDGIFAPNSPRQKVTRQEVLRSEIVLDVVFVSASVLRWMTGIEVVMEEVDVGGGRL